MTTETKLKTKTIGFVIVILASLIAVAALGLNALWRASEKDNIARLTQLMTVTLNIVRSFEQLAVEGKLSEAQAKIYATQMLRDNKYHNSEYVYVVDEKLNFVATPLDPQLHDTSFNDFKDASGRSIGQMVERLVGNQTNQLITYNWNSEREGEIVDLTSVVMKTSRWGWYVGTGISYKEADERYWGTAKWLLTSSVVIALVIAGILAWFGFSLTRSLGGEVGDVRRIVLKVSRGDLRKITGFDNATEESIMGAMQYMQRGLIGVVSGIKKVTHALSEHTADADARAHELDKLTQALSEQTQMVASAVTELSESANQVSQNAERAAEHIHTADLQGRKAFSLTEESARTIALLEGQIEKAGKNIEVLESEVKNIETVLAVIQGIAEQTNLLALNAAIEAARAGDQGRGFAVVADEVRGLAQRTQTSTEEIQQMINNLQMATKDARSAVNTSVTTSETAVSKATQVTDELKTVAEALSQLAEMSHQIALAAKEQMAAGEDTAHRIVLISDSATKTAKVSKQAQAASELTSQLTADLELEIDKFQLENR